jgi:hypothetical protein
MFANIKPMMEAKIESKQIHKYDLLEKTILGIIYFNGGKISKTKLMTLLYLLSDKIEELKERIDPYIFIKSKKMWDTSVDIIVDGLWDEDHLIYNLSNEIELTKKGYKKINEYLSDLTKEELEAIKEVVAQFKDISEEGLINLILENLKHS